MAVCHRSVKGRPPLIHKTLWVARALRNTRAFFRESSFPRLPAYAAIIFASAKIAVASQLLIFQIISGEMFLITNGIARSTVRLDLRLILGAESAKRHN